MWNILNARALPVSLLLCLLVWGVALSIPAPDSGFAAGQAVDAESPDAERRPGDECSAGDLGDTDTDGDPAESGPPMPTRASTTDLPYPPPAQLDERAVTVYITRTGERYHRGSCHHLSRSKYPVSLTEAVRRGYTPCKVCRPPR